MSNLLNIYNENFGQHVATNGIYIAVSNTNSKPYDCDEGFMRIGEVSIYQKNRFSTNYSFAKTYRNEIESRGDILSYYTEQSASAQFTASIRYESGSYVDDSLACAFIVLEDGTVISKQTSFGSVLAMCDRFLAISDIAFSQSIANIEQNYASVYIYKLYDETNTGSCFVENNDLFTLPDIPFCGITGSAADGFGRSIAISNDFFAIGSPFKNSNSGSVDIYLYTSSNCGYYKYYQTITSSNSADKYFGTSVYIDKYDQDKLVVSSGPITGSKVFVYFRVGNIQSSGSYWTQTQTLSQDTSSKWLRIQGDEDLDWFPINQSNSRYGYSIAVAKNNLVVGAPNDLVYYEYSSSLALTGSQTLRQRGSIYYYALPQAGSKQFVLVEKLYGDTNTFKDNMLGYDVDINNQYVIAGSPKPYFPFSSLYLSESINRYNTNLQSNDFGASTFNGQTMLYNISKRKGCPDQSLLKIATTTPIGYRKKLGEAFTAFGSSVALSEINLVIGSPSPLNDDLYLSKPYAIEQSGSGQFNCAGDSSDDVLYIRMEDAICNCDGYDLNSDNSGSIVLTMESEPVSAIFGKAFIYDFADLQTNPIIGNIFYSYNKFVVNNTGSILSDLLKNPLQQLDDYVYGTYQSQITLHEKQYICTVDPGEFNISTNPTAITSSLVGPYCVINKDTFDFSNLDIVLRYINYKLTSTHVESWWDVLVSGDVQESIFGFLTSSVVNYTDNRLTSELICELSNKDFDVNKDGVINYADAYMIWDYYIQNLTIENYQQYVSPTSKRKKYDDIIYFLDQQTGKGNQNKVKAEFFDYNFSSSVDPTGSYLAPYINQVGLYAGADLVAVAKLASPIKNNGLIPINIVVKWDT